MLPVPSSNYSLEAESQNRAQIKRELDRKLERGRDIEMGEARVVLTSPDGSRFALTVSDLGVLSATAL